VLVVVVPTEGPLGPGEGVPAVVTVAARGEGLGPHRVESGDHSGDTAGLRALADGLTRETFPS
jgi:hypothetical protein